MIKHLKIISLTVAIVTFASFGLGWKVLWDLGLLGRLKPVSAFDVDLEPISSKNYLPKLSDVEQSFVNLLAGEGFSNMSKSIDSIIVLQNWLGNNVKKVGSYSGVNPDFFSKFQCARQEETGLGCEDMSQIFFTMLKVLGFEVRTVQLFSSDFSPDETHVLVEGKIDGRWIAFDPTFNLTFKSQDDGRLLGVQEIVSRLKEHGPASVMPVFHGERHYPARIDKYYMDWRPLFSNAYVTLYMSKNDKMFDKMPPLRFFKGPVRYYFGENLILYASLFNKVYFLVVVVLPLLSFLSFTAFLVCHLNMRSKVKCVE